MQAQSDIFLGWTRVTGQDGIDRDYYLRQLRDWKFSMPIEQMIRHCCVEPFLHKVRAGSLGCSAGQMVIARSGVPLEPWTLRFELILLLVPVLLRL
jgi:Uncharacterized protein conserved in bacteria (DUF2252)